MTTETLLGPGIVLQGCKHHWLIEATAKPFTMGTCTHCGEQREFKNDIWARPEDRFIKEKPAVKPVEQGRRKRAGLTTEDFRRWGKMGGRGRKKNREEEPQTCEQEGDQTDKQRVAQAAGAGVP